MTPALRTSLTRWLLGILPSRDLPTVATDALSEGIDSPSLRILAGLTDPDAMAATRWVMAIAAELSLNLPTADVDRVLLVARDVAGQILSGHVSPYEGAAQVWGLCSHADVVQLRTFVGLASEIDDCRHMRVHDADKYDRLIAAYESDIVHSARALVRSVAA